MATWTINENRLLGQQIDERSTTAKHRLGETVKAKDADSGEGEFIYLPGVASAIVGSWATYNQDSWATTLSAANAIGPLAIAMSICTASYYGWWQIKGKATGAAKSVASGAAVFLTSSAGKMDDASVAGDRVNRAHSASTTTAGLAEFRIDYPFVDDKSN